MICKFQAAMDCMHTNIFTGVEFEKINFLESNIHPFSWMTKLLILYPLVCCVLKKISFRWFLIYHISQSHYPWKVTSFVNLIWIFFYIQLLQKRSCTRMQNTSPQVQLKQTLVNYNLQASALNYWAFSNFFNGCRKKKCEANALLIFIFQLHLFLKMDGQWLFLCTVVGGSVATSMRADISSHFKMSICLFGCYKGCTSSAMEMLVQALFVLGSLVQLWITTCLPFVSLGSS